MQSDLIRQLEDSARASAVDPAASIMAIDNEKLRSVALQVRDMLAETVEAI